ncbi:16S rRNA (uracil(1498)-N(3))-methyltransferase [Sedimentibacter sp. zth1]|uniref:RsmE family RNA methyltransferase n=1 Tax=Sedimentibacter sp. zth1 TaxID=2816908 RepID=UPI001A92255B|nr:RsmE family RNA methyltransferase [Sedimentibacter sp. zth1]QSX06618.1 16S rRNA (uracil(1498)-N(3))-methyltransferase [Sedimentibacter sp. zth1]
MFRYFTNESKIINQIVNIKGTDAKHLKNTLRAEIGQEVAIVTEEAEYVYNILDFINDEIVCKFNHKTDINNESNIHITLVQGLPKQAKMEDIIQQNVEVGVKSFIPLITERCVVKLNDKSRELKKLERWRKVAHESSKQSKRNIVPNVFDVMTLKELIAKIKDENAQIIVPYELEGNKTLKEALTSGKDKYYIIIGPEGGFDENEIAKLQEIGADIVTLGKRILRTETAGIVASSIILFANNEMGR